MSESKARMFDEIVRLKRGQNEATAKLVRLLTYVLNMQEDNPQIVWPELPDIYSEAIWRCAA